MPILMSPCPTCGRPTPHNSEGHSTHQLEPDGRTSQAMKCVVCETSTRVYFTPGSNEFQENLDTPDGTGVEPDASAAGEDS
jgi:hypothetical protein